MHRPTASLNAYECLSVALAYDKYLNPEYHLRARESLQRAIIASYVMFGRDEEASRQSGQLLRLKPGLTLDGAADELNRMLPFQPELVRDVVKTFEKSGLLPGP